ncbi:MAG: biopolymer transporter ExbD [Acidobacteriota bacterium]|nr:MAG: biopolymer transporter ExbD [Acidobacteriota bacterium]
MGMSMPSSGNEGASPHINVTPLIDVLLVLLIIFMVITPMKPSRFEAKVPAEPKPEQQQANVKPNPLTLVVALNRETGGITLNNEAFGNITDTEPLSNRLKAIFQDRTNNGVFREGTNEVEKTIFIKSPKSMRYGDVVKVIDAAKVAGASPIGLQIDDLAN